MTNIRNTNEKNESRVDSFTIIANLIDSERIVFSHKLFIDFMGGSHVGAAFLSKLWYWTPKSKMNGWIAKSYDEWHEEIRATKRQITTARKKLKELGVLEFKVKKFNGFPTVHYKILQSELMGALVTFCHNRKLHNVTNDSDIMLQTNDSDIMLQTITLSTTLNTNNERERTREKDDFLNPSFEDQSQREEKEKSCAEKENEFNAVEFIKDTINSASRQVKDSWFAKYSVSYDQIETISESYALWYIANKFESIPEQQIKQRIKQTGRSAYLASFESSWLSNLKKFNKNAKTPNKYTEAREKGESLLRYAAQLSASG